MESCEDADPTNILEHKIIYYSYLYYSRQGESNIITLKYVLVVVAIPHFIHGDKNQEWWSFSVAKTFPCFQARNLIPFDIKTI